ncbi:MAG: hypothetical protein ACFHWX_13190 [Bacteroidota bacterium]
MKRGVYFSASDQVLNWTLAFLKSFRLYNPELPLVWIPFNEDCDKTAELSKEYQFETFRDLSFGDMQALGQAYDLGHSSHGQYWFRRYTAFWGPLDHFIYLDARQVLLADLSPVFDLLQTDQYDFLYYDIAPDQVYTPGPLRKEFIQKKGARSFLSGFWGSRKGLFGKEEMLSLGYESMHHRDQLNPRNTDQAFINYCVDSKPGLKTGHIAELLGGYIHKGWANQRGRVYPKGKNYYLWDYRGLDHRKKVLFLHWAGFHWDDALPQSHILNKFSPPSVSTRLKRIINRMKRKVKSLFWLRKWMGDI